METRAKSTAQKGVAYNVQGNKTARLKEVAPELYKKLNPPGSAKAWYIKQKGAPWPACCIVNPCNNIIAEQEGKAADCSDGAHVFLNGDEYSVFVIPVCRSCNVKVISLNYTGHPKLLCVLSDEELSILNAAHEYSVDVGKSRVKPHTRSERAAAKKKTVERLEARDAKAAEVAEKPVAAPAPVERVLCGAPTVRSRGKRTCKLALASCPHDAHKEYHKNLVK